MARGNAEIDTGFKAVEIGFQDEVDHAADRVGAVNRRGAVFQHFHGLHHRHRDGVDVAGDDTAAVDQDQGALIAETAQGHGGGTGTAAVIDSRVGGGTGNGRNILQEIADGERAGLVDGFAFKLEHRAGGFGIHALDARAGHLHGVDGFGSFLGLGNRSQHGAGAQNQGTVHCGTEFFTIDHEIHPM